MMLPRRSSSATLLSFLNYVPCLLELPALVMLGLGGKLFHAITHQCAQHLNSHITIIILCVALLETRFNFEQISWLSLCFIAKHKAITSRDILNNTVGAPAVKCTKVLFADHISPHTTTKTLHAMLLGGHTSPHSQPLNGNYPGLLFPNQAYLLLPSAVQPPHYIVEMQGCMGALHHGGAPIFFGLATLQIHTPNPPWLHIYQLP